MTSRKVPTQGGATTETDDDLLPDATQQAVSVPTVLDEQPVTDDGPAEDETEAAVTVEAWARAGGTPVPGREAHNAVPFESLGAFVDTMRADGKGAARPSYFARRFRAFLREPRD